MNQNFNIIPVSALAAHSASFDTKASKMPVANYREVTLFVNVTAVTGSVTIAVLCEDPITAGVWHTLDSFTAITVAGTAHKALANFGTNLAIDVTLTGTATMSVSGVAKQ